MRWLAFSLTMWTAAAAADPCAPALAHIASVEGRVEVRRAAQTQWAAPQPDTALCAGDSVRVLERSRAAIRLANQTTLRLDQGTALTLSAPPDDGPSLIEQLSGGLLVITRTPRPFRVRTPFFNANVEGTEFLVRVAPEGARVAVFEGRVVAENALGRVELGSGEQAEAGAAAAPRKALVVRPADAVQWTLHVPAVLDAAPPDSPRRRAVQDAAALLAVGRLDQALPQIDALRRDDPRDAEALALRVVADVVEGRREEALRLGRQAVELRPDAAPAWIALSYAQQALFDLEGAALSVRRALEADARSASAWVRRAELQLSAGARRDALASVRRAVELDPASARAQAVLGFAALAALDTAAARVAFEAAARLDAADALPRLGLGLAKIRDGDLAGGRAELEVAAALEPRSSLVRSTLGKAYFDEYRDALARSQYALAQDLDPLDPTPHLYESLLAYAGNEPVAALHSLERSIALNDDRAVYRSRLLLDEDRAVRAAGLASVHAELGFDRLALLRAVESSAADPANHSAHAFLAQAFARQPRQAVTSASELLQAQLLQRASSVPVRAPAPLRDAAQTLGFSPMGTGLGEYSALLDRRGLQGQLSLGVGNFETYTDQASVAGLFGSTALSAGQYKYRSRGWRDNSDVDDAAYSVMGQIDATPEVGVQVELRRRDLDKGYTDLKIEPFLAASRRTQRREVARVGLRVSPAPHADILLSVLRAHLDETQHIPLPGPGPCASFAFSVGARERGDQVDLQTLWRGELGSVTAGLGGYRTEGDNSTALPCAPATTTQSRDRGEHAYLHGNAKLAPGVALLAGVAHERVRDKLFEVSKTSPKLGVLFEPTRDWTLRVVRTRAVKPALIASQTLQPTHLLGFAQFADDVNATVQNQTAAALDYAPGSGFYAGGSWSRRRADYPLHVATASPVVVPIQARAGNAYAYWAPKGSRHALAAEVWHDRLSMPPAQAPTGKPSRLATTRVPLSLRWFGAAGWSAGAVVQGVRQTATDAADGQRRRSTFALADVTLTYRLPRRAGTISLDLQNITDKQFSYQDLNFLAVEQAAVPVAPARTVMLRTSLVF